MKPIVLLLSFVLFSPSSVESSETEYLGWSRLTLECTNRSILEIEMTGSAVYRHFVITFQGDRFELSQRALDRLEGFPLSSISTWSEHSWTGGPAMTIRLSREILQSGTATPETVEIYVDESGARIQDLPEIPHRMNLPSPWFFRR